MTNVPPLTPPGHAADTQSARQDRRSWWPGLAIGALLLLGLGVVWLLPDLISPEVSAPEISTPSTTPPPVALPSPVDDEPRVEAEKRLAEILRLRAELETSDVAVWAQDRYPGILETVQAGDQAMGQGRFRDALDHYRTAIGELERLDQSRPDRYQSAMATGQAALTAGQADTADRQFRIALALRPDDQDARSGLTRAANLTQLLALMAQGAELETDQQWDDAHQVYAQAAALDAAYSPVREALQRVGDQIRERDFRRAMSDLLKAIERGALSNAEQALTRARRLRPQAPELAEAERQLAATRKQLRLSRLRRQATKAGASEDWETAAKRFRQALKLDPTASFARGGLDLAKQRLQLKRNIDRYLERPERLQDARVLDNAKNLLAAAEAITDAGPKLQAQRRALQRLVTTAASPVTLLLRSDDATDIVIYRVGRFGHLQQRRIQMRPGTYTAVGTREGYRDVRKVFSLRAGDPVTEISIRCEERI